MAIKPQNQPQKNTTPPPAPPKAPEKTAADAPKPTDGEAKPKKSKKQRVRLVSTTAGCEGFWVRARKDVIEKHGLPLDPKGNPMEVRAGTFGLTDAEKAERKAQKEADKAAFDAMTPDQKMAHSKLKREARQAKKAAKKEKERDELIASIKADIAAGRL